MKNALLLALVAGYINAEAGSQVYEQPSYALSSHPTLEVTSIERWSDQTVVHISVQNQSISGSFCIDPDTYLLNSLGKEEYRLLSMEGIPACPEQYRFNSIGEVLRFTLVFAPVPDEVTYLDLSERCEEACVSVQYILLDEDLNQRINEGFELYRMGRLEASLKVFEDIMSEDFDDYSPVFGTIYLYLMSIHYELGNSRELRDVFDELRESFIVGRDEFIESARETGLVR